MDGDLVLERGVLAEEFKRLCADLDVREANLVARMAEFKRLPHIKDYEELGYAFRRLHHAAATLLCEKNEGRDTAVAFDELRRVMRWPFTNPSLYDE